MADDQTDIIAFLGTPSSYGPATDRVERVETHASIVFLAGERAYKLKRAVTYPYLDFSSCALRQAACAAELALNRRTAPQLYLDIRAIGRDAAGALGWDCGAPLDWVVVMGRFDQEQVFDALAQRGGLTRDLLHALVAHIAEFHAAAQPCPGRGGAAAMRAVAETNLGTLRACRAARFAPADVVATERGVAGELARLAGLLDARRARGKVRRCHGDLHLRNICLVDGKPVLFDCLEFSDELASIDVLYDLAFLLMDLGHRGRRDLANLVLNRYLDLTGEDDGLAAIPLFLSLRAAIRAHVAGTILDRGWAADGAALAAEARRYLAEALAALKREPARLVAVGGLSGSGKSTLAAGLAPELRPSPGARLLRSDVLRKRRFGLAPEIALPPRGYTAAVTRTVYDELCRKAALALEAGVSAVIDAVALRPEERDAFAEIARRAGVRFTGLWLEAPEAAMAARIAARRGDASDATVDILRRQRSVDPGALDWLRIDASAGAEATLAAARRALA